MTALGQPASAPVPKTLNALLHMPAHMDLSQIELIYRAEGNANLVLALPQFKKVLRLPKMISSRQAQQQQQQASHSYQQAEPEAKQQQQGQANVSAKTKTSSAKAGDLTMPDFMAYIEIIRRLLGNEFVCEADIVAIPKESDRCWINEHIRAARPIARLDKEFVGPFGLLLPDVTQLPAMFDAMLANLQAKSTARATKVGHTYAIEIKPKQGWLLLPSDVSDLFDLMPAAATTASTTRTDRQPTGSAGSAGTSATALPISAAESTNVNCKCRYCSMQLLKLSNGRIKRLSHYCPMDLFSGASGRMLDALSALFDCPQNNLRVFHNGNLIYGDHEHSISCEELHTKVFQGEIMGLIKHLLVVCLLREYECRSNVAGNTEGIASEAAAVVPPIGETKSEIVASAGDSVKAVVGQAAAAESPMQRHTKRCKLTITTTASAAAGTSTATTTTTITGKTASTYTKSTNVAKATQTETETTATQAQINKTEISSLPKNCVLQKILNLQLLTKRHFRHMWQVGAASRSTPSYNALRALVAQPGSCSLEQLPAEQAYMLGATALDCSIMLTFQEIQCSDAGLTLQSLQPWHVHLAKFQRHFLTQVKVLDLDPKPDSHFYKFIKQTHEIGKCCKALN